jgi:hypothetical protein
VSRTRKNFTLEAAAITILDRVGNYSDYVNKLVLQHAADWTESLALLRRAGWQPAEILAACDALGGHGLSSAGRSGPWIASELARLDEEMGVFRERQVLAARRRACLQQLTEDPAQAHSLAVVVREYRLGNEDCQRAVRHRPRDTSRA